MNTHSVRPRVRINQEWGDWAGSEIRRQLHLFRPSLRGWPPGTLATVVGGSRSHDCVTLIKDGGKTRTVFNVRFLEPLTMKDRAALARIAYPLRMP